MRFSNNNWVLGFSKDSHLGLFNTATEKMITLKPGHQDCSVKSGSVDPCNKYVASTGSDGFLNIYKFAEDHTSASLMTKVRISSKKVATDRTQEMEFEWVGDGSEEMFLILVPGQKHLNVIVKDDEDDKSWEVQEEDRVSHDHEITFIKSISNEILLTYSSVDTTLKVWRLNENECTNMFTIKLKLPAIAIQYDINSKMLVVMDNECKLSYLHQDLTSDKVEPVEAEEEEIDLDGFEIPDDEEEEEEKPVEEKKAEAAVEPEKGDAQIEEMD